MNNGIEIEVSWFDDDVIEYQFRCSNGFFSGRAAIYASHEELRDMAHALKGFPSSPSDVRDIECGTFDQQYANGGIRMHFYCVDSAGHARVDVKLRGDACAGMGEVESVALRIALEAATIDSFVEQIPRLETRTGATAILQMAR